MVFRVGQFNCVIQIYPRPSLDKMGFNSASVRDICKIFASIGGLGVRLLNTANKILPQPNLVAMATKFETKGL